MSDIEERMIVEGFKPPRIIEDGKLHRFATSDKPRDTAGWYWCEGKYFCFGDWRTGLVVRGRNGDEERMTFRAPRPKRVEPDRKAVLEKARSIWEKAGPALTHPSAIHPYLVAKKVKPYGIRQHGDALVIPMSDEIHGKTRSLQFIAHDGSKRYLRGGQVKGCRFLIPGRWRNNQAKGKTALCEGYATGATIHEATDWAVIVCFDAANLVRVARTLPKANDYVVCADNDWQTEGNPGAAAGMKATKILDAKLFFPMGIKGTDFNDYAAERGIEAVRKRLEDGVFLSLRKKSYERGIEETRKKLLLLP